MNEMNHESCESTPRQIENAVEEGATFGSGPALSRRSFISAGAAVAATAGMGAALNLAGTHVAMAQSGRAAADRLFAFSTPFSGQDSFSGQIGGLNQGVADFGGKLNIADASFDLKKQNDQITALAASKPDALIVLPVDPVGVSKAVSAASDAGVPVFLMDSYVPNATAVFVGMHNNYGMGVATTDYMIKRLEGKGKIAIMELPINEAWNMRDIGRDFLLSQHPDIEVVASWAFDPTGKTTPRSAADSFLAAHPDLDAIWCAWDNAAMEASLAVMAAGKADSIFTTGVDGGPAAFEVIRSGGPFSYTCAQSFYSQAYDLMYFAHRYLDGQPVPRMVINPVYGVTREMLEVAGDRANEYDKPGVAAELGWSRIL